MTALLALICAVDETLAAPKSSLAPIRYIQPEGDTPLLDRTAGTAYDPPHVRLERP
jgi:hypothetical protein